MKKLGNIFVNLKLIPLVIFDKNDFDVERITFFFPSGSISFLKGIDINEEDFEKLKKEIEDLAE
jgi:hypothetical protein